MIRISHPDTLTEIEFRADLQSIFPLRKRQIRMEPQEATVQGCTAEWIGGLILVVIAKPFTDAFLKALGETAGKGLASQIKKWFSRARAKGYAKVSLAYLDRKGRLIGKPPWVKSIIQFDIAVRLKDGSTKIASF